MNELTRIDFWKCSVGNGDHNLFHKVPPKFGFTFVLNHQKKTILLSTNSFRSNLGKTLIKMGKTSQIVIFSQQNTDFGHFEGVLCPVIQAY